jgi:hypothetical protein
MKRVAQHSVLRAKPNAEGAAGGPLGVVVHESEEDESTREIGHSGSTHMKLTEFSQPNLFLFQRAGLGV